MNENEVMALLEAHRSERGLANWERLGEETGGLTSFGIGLTQLRKLARQVGRDHELALKLWESDNHDVRIVSLLVDDPKKLTREQAERQVEEVGAGLLAHVFSTCGAPLAKAPFVSGMALEWIDGTDTLRKQCGYALIYELSKIPRPKEFTDETFLSCIDRIRERFDGENSSVRLAMGTALMGIGKRNRRLNQVALKLALELGPIDFSENSKACEPFDVAKHLTSAYIKEKLGL